MPKKRILLDNKMSFQKARRAVRFHARGRISEQDLEDLTQDVMGAVLKIQRSGNQIKSLPTYISKTAKNIVSNFIKKSSSQPNQVDNMDDFEAPENRSPENSISFLQKLKEKDPDYYDSLEKSIEFVGLFYYLKRNRDSANDNFFSHIQAINILKEAKAKIDAIDEFSYYKIKHSPFVVKMFNRDYIFYEKTGPKISAILKAQVQYLENEIYNMPGRPPKDFFPRCFQDITELEDWILDSISQLRADPSMLLLRVFYRIFKVRAGRYSARAKIKEILLEFAEIHRKTYLRDCFKKINKNTNFETLRKKIYQKGARSFYDKLADYIYSRCYIQRGGKQKIRSGRSLN
ncbi:MAG: hypothetical protein Q8O91_05600 [Candidatus Aminicenantes bacterium]|nr:hypothetical protein [Candidatus Aminicenantes bacterium]